jgi:hypothetical protein
VSRLLPLVIGLLLVVPAQAATPRTLPASALPGLQSRSRALTVVALAAETIDHAGLRRVLEDGAYRAGSEREFFGRSTSFDHVTARVLRFDRAAGASRYLAWVRGHAAELLGSPRAVTALGIGRGGFLFRPHGCGCHADRPTYLAAWRRGSLVATLQASGEASVLRVEKLARTLDRGLG